MKERIDLVIRNFLSSTLLVVYASFRLIGKVFTRIIDFNDISGWQMQLRASGLEAILEISLIVFFITYAILDIRKTYRNILFSKIHLAFVAICAVMNNFGNIEAAFYLGTVVICISIFLVNLYLSFSNKAK